MDEATFRGIDLDELRGESFSHPNHYAMLREHLDRVRWYEIQLAKSEFELAAEESERREAAARIVDELVPKLEKRQARMRAVETRERHAEYEFTDRQLEIARR